jgi:peptidoglycan/LPS O-acetylase OafA/YrhL
MPAEAAPSAARYRPDIDGLRALAILPVVFYHFRVPGFSGGFVGVDVFFVISGYLITQLLTDPARPLGLLAFYARRIRRLGPALAAMVAVSTIAGLILLPPNALIAYGKSLISVAAAGSNVFFWRALASYFAPAGENHPLLHTWSLAVEEQFYIAYPLVLILLARFGRRTLVAGVLVAGLISLAAAAWLAPRAPSASFYLAPTRAWELLLGGALALLPAWRPLGGPLPAAAGLIMIAIAVAVLGPTSQVPGIAALLPCVGAGLLIHAGATDPANPVSRFLGARPLVGLGLISYALYLWHWPINVYLRRYILIEPPGPLVTALAIALAVALATASYFLIERPTRRGPILRRRRSAFVFAAAMAATLVVGGGLMATGDGWPRRFPGMIHLADQPGEQPPSYNLLNAGRPDFGEQSNWLVKKSAPNARRVMIWGDSYAKHLTPGFLALQDRYPFSVYQHVGHACPPVPGFDPASLRDCKVRNDAGLKVITDQKIDTVIMAGRWYSYTSTGKMRLEEVGAAVRRLRAMGVKVVVVGQLPNYAFDFPDEYHYRRMRHGAAADEGWAANFIDAGYNTRLRAVVGDTLFDPTPVFCSGQQCRYRERGMYVVKDMGHLTTYGSEQLVGALLASPVFQAAVAGP